MEENGSDPRFSEVGRVIHFIKPEDPPAFIFRRTLRMDVPFTKAIRNVPVTGTNIPVKFNCHWLSTSCDRGDGILKRVCPEVVELIEFQESRAKWQQLIFRIIGGPGLG